MERRDTELPNVGFPEKGDARCARAYSPFEDLQNQFTYHKPVGDQTERYAMIRTAGLNLAQVIVGNCPNNADRSAAIRLIREAVMTANAAIACGESRL